MDRQRFLDACDKIVGNKRDKNGIGTLSEKTMHAVLKEYYDCNPENHETKIGTFVADIVCEDGIIEIQTRQLYKLNRKLDLFLEYCDVTVVHPLPAKKYISWIDKKTGECTNRRKSPKKCTIYDAINELYSIKFTLDNPRIKIILPMLEVEDVRYLNGWSKDKKRGSSRCDRIPIDIIDEIEINNVSDFSIFIPKGLKKEFTSNDFAKVAKIDINTARTTINILSYLEIIKNIGKSGRKKLYIVL